MEVGKASSHQRTAPIWYSLMATRIPGQIFTSPQSSRSLAATPVSQSEYAIVKPSSSHPLAQAGRSRRRHVRAAERGAVTGDVRWRCPTTTPASSASASSASDLARPRREGSRRPANPGRRRGRPDGTQDRKSPPCQRRLLRLPRPRLDIPDRPRGGLKVPGSSFHQTTRAPRRPVGLTWPRAPARSSPATK